MRESERVALRGKAEVNLRGWEQRRRERERTREKLHACVGRCMRTQMRSSNVHTHTKDVFVPYEVVVGWMSIRQQHKVCVGCLWNHLDNLRMNHFPTSFVEYLSVAYLFFDAVIDIECMKSIGEQYENQQHLNPIVFLLMVG